MVTLGFWRIVTVGYSKLSWVVTPMESAVPDVSVLEQILSTLHMI